jgi:hypothetical protein
MSSSSTNASDSLTSSSSLVNSLASKPLFAGVYAGLLDKFVLGNNDLIGCAKFGGSVAAGCILGNIAGTFTAASMGSSVSAGSNTFADPIFGYNYSGTTILQRAIEIGTSSGVSFGINKFLLQNDWRDGSAMGIGKRLGVIALSEVLSDYTMDYLQVRPISYLM